MNYNTTNFSNIINNAILPNMLGEETTIAENLSNVVEVAKAISSLSSDDLKNFKRNLIVGCYNEVIHRIYDGKDFRIAKNAVEFGGALQRLANAGIMVARESHLLNLENGQSYLDGKFYGANVDSRVILDTKAFKVVYSISDDDFSQNFTDAQKVREYIGMILENAENSIRIEIAQLEKRLILDNICKAHDDNRRIRLLTLFNEKLGLSGDDALTMSDIYADREKSAYFYDFVKSCVSKCRAYMREPNKKYNDGDIVTWTPSEKLHGVFLSDFIEDTDFIGSPIMFHETNFGTIETVATWQNATEDILPSFTDVSKIVTTNGTTPKTYTNIVGIVYDSDSMGITTVRNKVTVEPVGSEGFENFHHHIANKYYLDTRFGSVVFTLD